MDTSNPKVAKIETFRNPSLFDIFKAQDDQIVPRKFYGQQTGLAKVQLYPKMGGESDQVDGVRKDGSDALENQAHLDAQNQQILKKQSMMENQPRMKENMKRPAGSDFSRDPRMDPRRGMIGDPRDPRNRDPRIRDDRSMIHAQFDPRRQNRK